MKEITAETFLFHGRVAGRRKKREEERGSGRIRKKRRRNKKYMKVAMATVTGRERVWAC